MAAPAEAGDSRRTVMIAIDGSKQAEEAFDWYAQFIHRNENHVILVHAPECAEVTQAVKDKLSDTEIQKMIAKEKKEMDEMQNKYSTKLKQHPNVNNYEYKTAYGAKPGEALVHTAEEVKADMVIMGTRGLGTIRRTIMGSVSDYVVHHAHCPVIVCRH